MKQVLDSLFNLLGVFSSEPYKIGNCHQGGKIAYLDSTGKHGMIAALKDQDSYIIWNNGNTNLSLSTGSGLGLGQVNTNKIVANQDKGHYAARRCFDLVIDGFNDWYLPSKDELNKLFLNKDLIGGFSYKYYWSSSSDENGAWDQDFMTGYQSINNVNAKSNVRAVRTF